MFGIWAPTVYLFDKLAQTQVFINWRDTAAPSVHQWRFCLPRFRRVIFGDVMSYNSLTTTGLEAGYKPVLLCLEQNRACYLYSDNGTIVGSFCIPVINSQYKVITKWIVWKKLKINLKLMYVTPLPFQQHSLLTESCISLALGVFLI